MKKLSDFYKSLFNCKVYKVSLNAGCTCPNRDGTKGNGGCIFCSQRGSGDFIKDCASIKQQFDEGVKLIENKARGRSGANNALYVPYFQAFTSTYGNVADLEKKYIEALQQDNVCGIAIATRPDCISEEIIEVLKRLLKLKLKSTGKASFLQIELGLQTSNEETGRIINRCYTNEDYEEAVKLLQMEFPEAHIVTHLIFGLPGENTENMIDSVKFVCQTNGRKMFGLKITSLYVLKETKLEKMFLSEKYTPMSEDEYFTILEKVLKTLPENCVVHRLTGDPPKKEILAPLWSLNKKQVLNRLNKILTDN